MQKSTISPARAPAARPSVKYEGLCAVVARNSAVTSLPATACLPGAASRLRPDADASRPPGGTHGAARAFTAAAALRPGAAGPGASLTGLPGCGRPWTAGRAPSP
ncbi:hypothetical protein GCM10023329_06780 [Streptomyces sanyensis]|uniref:Uncharacterized protein n=1 Tax=Streptomyces sanyensis TaxID=568869 RepID=A0ABP8ZR24_9ACTN